MKENQNQMSERLTGVSGHLLWISLKMQIRKDWYHQIGCCLGEIAFMGWIGDILWEQCWCVWVKKWMVIFVLFCVVAGVLENQIDVLMHININFVR